MTPKMRKWFHYGMAALFTALVPVSLLTSLKSSVPFLVFLSLYAIIGTHLAGASAEMPSEGD